MQENPNKKVPLHVMVDPRLKKDIENILDKDNRFVSLSHLTRVLLEHAVKEHRRGNIKL